MAFFMSVKIDFFKHNYPDSTLISWHNADYRTCINFMFLSDESVFIFQKEC